MRLVRAILCVPVLLAVAGAQDAPTPREMKQRFNDAAIRATANFRAADSIAGRLSAGGMSLHPQLVTLRLRIESALDQTQAALDASDYETAGQTVRRAEALLDRFARQIGGD